MSAASPFRPRHALQFDAQVRPSSAEQRERGHSAGRAHDTAPAPGTRFALLTDLSGQLFEAMHHPAGLGPVDLGFATLFVDEDRALRLLLECPADALVALSDLYQHRFGRDLGTDLLAALPAAHLHRALPILAGLAPATAGHRPAGRDEVDALLVDRALGQWINVEQALDVVLQLRVAEGLCGQGLVTAWNRLFPGRPLEEALRGALSEPAFRAAQAKLGLNDAACSPAAS